MIRGLTGRKWGYRVGWLTVPFRERVLWGGEVCALGRGKCTRDQKVHRRGRAHEQAFCGTGNRICMTASGCSSVALAAAHLFPALLQCGPDALVWGGGALQPLLHSSVPPIMRREGRRKPGRFRGSSPVFTLTMGIFQGILQFGGGTNTNRPNSGCSRHKHAVLGIPRGLSSVRQQPFLRSCFRSPRAQTPPLVTPAGAEGLHTLRSRPPHVPIRPPGGAGACRAVNSGRLPTKEVVAHDWYWARHCGKQCYCCDLCLSTGKWTFFCFNVPWTTVSLRCHPTP